MLTSMRMSAVTSEAAWRTLDREIDGLGYELYGLSEGERRVVEESVG